MVTKSENCTFLHVRLIYQQFITGPHELHIILRVVPADAGKCKPKEKESHAAKQQKRTTLFGKSVRPTLSWRRSWIIVLMERLFRHWRTSVIQKRVSRLEYMFPLQFLGAFGSSLREHAWWASRVLSHCDIERVKMHRCSSFALRTSEPWDVRKKRAVHGSGEKRIGRFYGKKKLVFWVYLYIGSSIVSVLVPLSIQNKPNGSV